MMHNDFNARIAESDGPAIVHYLTVIKGAK